MLLAILTLWLLALPGFLNLSHFPGIVHVMSLVITAAPSLLILCSVEAILIAQWAQLNVYIAKCEITIPACILEGTDCSASKINFYCTHLLKYQVF